MKKHIIAVLALALSAFALQAKTWITDVKNHFNQAITIQSNDASSKNSTMNKARNGWDPHYKNPIKIDPGNSLIFNDFVVGWKSHDSKVTVMVPGRGDYIIQEDNNSIFLTSPGSTQRLEIFQRQGGDRTIGITINADGSLNAHTIV